MNKKEIIKNGLVKNAARSVRYAVSAAMITGAMSTCAALADTGTAIGGLFDTGSNIAKSFSDGFKTLVIPVGLAVTIYFIVRMCLATDAKDVAMYRKRLIITVVLAIVAYMLPGIFTVAKAIGEGANTQLGG